MSAAIEQRNQEATCYCGNLDEQVRILHDTHGSTTATTVTGAQRSWSEVGPRRQPPGRRSADSADDDSTHRHSALGTQRTQHWAGTAGAAGQLSRAEPAASETRDAAVASLWYL